jgi:hypothetical protein
MDKDIKICEYSGLRPVEGYKEEEVSPQDPAIDITTNPEGTNVWKELYDRYKETEGYKINKEIEIGDRDFMYKWIREKSGK